MLPGYLSSPINQECFAWESWELLARQALQAGWLFDFQPLDRPSSIRAELPVLQAPGILEMVYTETWPEGSPRSHFSGFTEAGWWVPEEGTAGVQELSLGCEREQEMLEMPAEMKRRCSLGSRGSCTEFLQPSEN